MPTPKTKKYRVIPNPELVHVLKGFKPAWGSDEDLNTVNRVIALEKKLEAVDNTVLRSGTKILTTKMKVIQFEERHLIRMLVKRSLDF